ncbi:MAG: thioredoxin family protein [Pseudomonadota bacterium]
MRELGGEDLDRLVARGAPVLAEFFGPNCAICRRLEPMLGALASEAGDALAVVRVDAGRDPALAERLAIRSVPTLILYNQGGARARRTGFATAAELRAWIKPEIGAAAPSRS